MESGVAGALLQCVYNGSISMFDMEIDRRPYHKNCDCALHKSKKNSSNQCSHRRKISVPTKQLWKDYSMSTKGTHYSSQCSSSAIPKKIETTHLSLCHWVENES
ncbi:hypothetical protein FRX31_030380 [Thalictrum thalictroides]|uniref:Uncharacterized protein n=1 Tax=Thalictrum thalictroides TaxID=46969 RepID=A0A7J6V4Y7_THATH|nr:hypothetical protein FRX31_030380 [Thalictrum thalictroides]